MTTATDLLAEILVPTKTSSKIRQIEEPSIKDLAALDKDDDDLDDPESPTGHMGNGGPDYVHLLNVINESFNQLI
jgi:hypothetical protein